MEATDTIKFKESLIRNRYVSPVAKYKKLKIKN
jgi:hypothetical protein